MRYDRKQQIRPYSSEGVREISLDTLNATDFISIKTADSAYVFVVTDPGKRRGVLTGGALGLTVTTSVLLGAHLGKNGRVSALFSGLCEGSRAIFFVESADGVEQLITSVITGLVHIKAGNTRHPQGPACGR
jgi:hypothetical protein